MQSKCPGQDSRNLSVSIHICPQCGQEVRVKCPSCKARVEKKTVPSCIQWCKEAKRCLGPDRWEKIMEALDQSDSDSKEN